MNASFFLPVTPHTLHLTPDGDWADSDGFLFTLQFPDNLTVAVKSEGTDGSVTVASFTPVESIGRTTPMPVESEDHNEGMDTSTPSLATSEALIAPSGQSRSFGNTNPLLRYPAATDQRTAIPRAPPFLNVLINVAHKKDLLITELMEQLEIQTTGMKKRIGTWTCISTSSRA